MNLNMIQSANETKNRLLSLTKKCETLIEQTHTKPQETLDFKMIKPRETFHFDAPIQLKWDWMIGWKSLDVYNSFSNIKEETNKFELYEFPDSNNGGVSNGNVRDEIERDLDISDITASYLQDEITAPKIILEYKEQVTKRLKDDKYMRILSVYVSSITQDFDCFLGTEVDLVEDDIRLVLDEYKSSFIVDELDELEPGIYTFKGFSKALFNFLQPEYALSNNSIDFELDDIVIQTKLVVRSGIIAIRLNEKSFFSTILGFNYGWDYKHSNEYISRRIVNLSITNKTHLKADVIVGSVVNGIRQSILYSFVLDMPSGHKVFGESETIHWKKINKSVVNTITFYLEDDNNKKVYFNGITLIFTLQLIGIWTFKWAFKN